MKKVIPFFIVCFTLCCFFPRAEEQDYFLRDYYAKNSILEERIRTIVAAGQLDSAMNYCNYLKESDSIENETYEIAIANISLLKGDKETAYQIVLKEVDYSLKIYGGSGNPFEWIYNYQIGEALCADLFLEQMLLNKVSDYYMAYDLPEKNLGLRLIQLNFRKNKGQAKYFHDIRNCNSDSCKKKCQNDFESQSEELLQDFKDLIQTNKGLFTERQIGLPKDLQFTFINSLKTEEEHHYFLPFFNEAYLAQKITPDQYVSELMNLESIKNPALNQYDLGKKRDSLCAIYSCKQSTMIRMKDSSLVFKKFSEGNVKFDTLRFSEEKYLRNKAKQK